MHRIGELRWMGLTVAMSLLVAHPASAAWLGYRNETAAAIVVQSSVVVNGKVLRGKAHVLYPGEIAWDNIAAPGARQLTIYDPKANNRQVFQDSINVVNQDIFLSVRLEKPAQVPNQPAQPATIRLVSIKPPGPAGVVRPKAIPPSTPAPVRPPNQPATPVPVAPPSAAPVTPPPGTIPVRPPPPASKSGDKP